MGIAPFPSPRSRPPRDGQHAAIHGGLCTPMSGRSAEETGRARAPQKGNPHRRPWTRCDTGTGMGRKGYPPATRDVDRSGGRDTVRRRRTGQCRTASFLWRGRERMWWGMERGRRATSSTTTVAHRGKRKETAPPARSLLQSPRQRVGWAWGHEGGHTGCARSKEWRHPAGEGRRERGKGEERCSLSCRSPTSQDAALGNGTTTTPAVAGKGRWKASSPSLAPPPPSPMAGPRRRGRDPQPWSREMGTSGVGDMAIMAHRVHVPLPLLVWRETPPLLGSHEQHTKQRRRRRKAAGQKMALPPVESG